MREHRRKSGSQCGGGLIAEEGGRKNPAVKRALFLYPANLERLNAVQAVPKEIRREVIASDTET